MDLINMQWKYIGSGHYISGNVHAFLWDSEGPTLFDGHDRIRLIQPDERAHIVNNAKR